MKKFILLLIVPILSFGQDLTYVPDNSFENFIENNFINDNYVITSGLNLNGSSGLNISQNLSAPIYDFTGIENFRNVIDICIGGPSILASSIDLSSVTLQAYIGAFTLTPEVSINNCAFVENIILPADTFNLTVSHNQQLNELIFQDDAIYQEIKIGYIPITNCNVFE